MGNKTSTIDTTSANGCDHNFVFRQEKIGKMTVRTDSCEKCYGDRVVYLNDLHKRIPLTSTDKLHVHTWQDNECISSIDCKSLRDETTNNYEIVSSKK